MPLFGFKMAINIFEKLAKYLFFHAAERTFQDFLGFWSKIQFLGRKKPISGDFWPFLIIFAFELMPAGASLWIINLRNYFFDEKSHYF